LILTALKIDFGIKGAGAYLQIWGICAKKWMGQDRGYQATAANKRDVQCESKRQAIRR